MTTYVEISPFCLCLTKQNKKEKKKEKKRKLLQLNFCHLKLACKWHHISTCDMQYSDISVQTADSIASLAIALLAKLLAKLATTKKKQKNPTQIPHIFS